ncbi:hypothetical protein VTO73DRAFT_7108 [Trametes versicolor]
MLEFHDGNGESLWAEVRLYLHVSTQVFTWSEWKNSICKVPRDARGFKIAIAFDMGKYVLALLTHDLLFRTSFLASESTLFRKSFTVQKAGGSTDVFEPSLVREPLVMKQNNLGNLIFGSEEWTHLQALWGIQVEAAKKSNAFTKLYRCFSTFQADENTFLRISDYDEGMDGGQWNTRRFQTTMFRFYSTDIDPSAPPSTTPRSKKTKKKGIDEEEEDTDTKKKKTRTFQAWSVIPVHPA